MALGYLIDASYPAYPSQSKFRIESQGYAYNISFFTNVAFERAGRYIIQTMLDGKLVSEKHLYVQQIHQPHSQATLIDDSQ